MITIIHPSRSRPELAFATIVKWLINASKANELEYILSIDIDDPEKEKYFEIADLAIKHKMFEGLNILYVINDNKSAIEAINNAAKIAKGDLFVVVSDDFSCEQGWDASLSSFLSDKKDFLVKTQDGIQKTLITLPIMDRTYYNRFGYVYHPSYVHMYSDQEMTMVGYGLDRIITLPLMFRHNHYSKGGIEKDAISEKNDSTYKQGHANLNARKRRNFDLKPEEIKKDWREIVWH